MENLEEIKKELEEIYQKFLNDERIQRMKEIPMHRGSNCYIHSFKVAKMAVNRAIRKREYDLKSVLLGAILHDYYLYDWRVDRDRRKKHGSLHPSIAESNAKKDFDIPKEVSDIILTHMWPINFEKFPNSKEARLVDIVDDIVATREFLSSAKHKKKNMEKHIQQISHLFDK